jgi:hypothetical protein
MSTPPLRGTRLGVLNWLQTRPERQRISHDLSQQVTLSILSPHEVRKRAFGSVGRLIDFSEHKTEHNNCRMRAAAPDFGASGPTVNLENEGGRRERFICETAIRHKSLIGNVQKSMEHNWRALNAVLVLEQPTY